MIFLDTNDLKTNELYLSLTKTDESNPERKWVPAYYFDICLNDGTKVGECNLKIDNSELTKYCGNIGYSIIEKYRGKHYSALASKLLLKLAKKHNLSYVLITCLPDNIASNKICKYLNAEFIEKVNVPKEHEMYVNHKELNIYKIEIL